MEEEKKETRIGLVKSFWKDKRKRSILILGLYAIFFSVIIFSVRSNSNHIATVPKETDNLTYANYNKYSYQATIYLNDEIYELNGTRYQEKNKFTYNEGQYYLLNKKNYLLNGEFIEEAPYILPLDYDNLTPEKINKYLTKGNFFSSTNYKNNDYEEVYLVNSTSFFNTNSSREIEIKVKYSDKEVTQVQLDFTNYFEDLDYHKLIIDIKYTNINKISNFDIPELLTDMEEE